MNHFQSSALILLSALTISGCELVDSSSETTGPGVSQITTNRAINRATLVRNVELRGQTLKVSRAQIGKRTFGVLQFLNDGVARRDQPTMAQEVIPLAEQVLGCAFEDRRSFAPDAFMPRNAVVVLPIICVDLAIN